MDYAAIATPGGINEGFANLAAAMARLPAQRRQQWLEEQRLKMQDRAMTNKEAGNPALDRYRMALGDAALERAKNQGEHYSNMDTTTGARVVETGRHNLVTEDQGSTGLAIKGLDADSKRTSREAHTANQGKHWENQDATATTRTGIAQQNADTNSDRVGVEATRAIPLTTHKEVPAEYGTTTKSIAVDRGLSPEERAAEGQRLRNASSARKHLDAMGPPAGTHQAKVDAMAPNAATSAPPPAQDTAGGAPPPGVGPAPASQKMMSRATLLMKAQKAGYTPEEAATYYQNMGYTIGD